MKKIKTLVLAVIAIVLLSAFAKNLKMIKLGIDWNGDSKVNGFVNIIKKEKKILKDGNEIQNFDLHFYENSKKLETHTININGYNAESFWDAESPFEIDSINKKKSFVLLHNGFPACGYGQNYFLFVQNKDNKVQLLDQWDTFFDAPYGNYQLFKPIDADSFARVLVSINGSDNEPINEEEEKANVTKSDSVVFYRQNDRWVKKQITPKDKVFWQKEMTIDDAYNTKF